MNEQIKERYLLRFRRNERDYSPDQAKKKNADIRKNFDDFDDFEFNKELMI